MVAELQRGLALTRTKAPRSHLLTSWVQRRHLASAADGLPPGAVPCRIARRGAIACSAWSALRNERRLHRRFQTAGKGSSPECCAAGPVVCCRRPAKLSSSVGCRFIVKSFYSEPRVTRLSQTCHTRIRTAKRTCRACSFRFWQEWHKRTPNRAGAPRAPIPSAAPAALSQGDRPPMPPRQTGGRRQRG